MASKGLSGCHRPVLQQTAVPAESGKHDLVSAVVTLGVLASWVTMATPEDYQEGAFLWLTVWLSDDYVISADPVTFSFFLAGHSFE